MKRLAILLLALSMAGAAVSQIVISGTKPVLSGTHVLQSTPGTGGGGSVVFDAQTVAVVNVVSTTMTTSMTVGAGTNRALVAFVWFGMTTTPAGLACNWDPTGTNQALTELTGANSGTNSGLTGASTLFVVLAPTSGTKNLTCTWTGSGEGHISAVSFTGVNQGSIAAAFPQTAIVNIGALTAGPVTLGPITSATGHQVVSSFAQSCAVWGTLSGTTVNTDDVVGPILGVASSFSSGAATVTATAAFAGTCNQIASGADVSP